MENLKERSFTFERTCFDITFCTGSGRRTPALQFAKNSYGAVAPPVAYDQGLTYFDQKPTLSTKTIDQFGG
jgi:hypothetical protein